MSNVLEEDDGYDSIDEDAELELSCALHDLALRVKTFEENMKDRFHHADGDDDGEISEEDIPEMDDAVIERRGTAASPKRSTKHRRRLSAKAAKQQSDDDDDELYDDDEDHEHGGELDYEDDEGEDRKGQPRERDDWDFQEQKEELSEMRQNIALLLQTIKAEAKALESHDDDDGDASIADENNQ
ncbi:hypothetical protein Gpo141_00007007 [Globisporangium polare]